jgi:hypothetical protein
MILTFEKIKEDIINGDSFYKMFPFMKKEFNIIRYQYSDKAFKRLLINLFKNKQLVNRLHKLYRQYKLGEDIKRFIKDNVIKNNIYVFDVPSKETFISQKIINILNVDTQIIATLKG